MTNKVKAKSIREFENEMREEFGDSKPTSLLFVIEDVVAEQFSPVFEQPTVAAGERIFKTKTLGEVPEGVPKSDFKLWLVGARFGLTFVMGSVLLLNGAEDAE